MNEFSEDQVDFTIGAGLKSEQLETEADWFTVRSLTSVNMSISVNGGPFIRASVGYNGGKFKTLRVLNESAEEEQILISHGTGQVPQIPQVTSLSAAVEIDAATRADLKRVSPENAGEVTLVNQIVNAGTGTVTIQDAQELTVINSGTINITANAITIPPGMVKTWRIYDPGARLPDILVSANSAGAEAHLVGII